MTDTADAEQKPEAASHAEQASLPEAPPARWMILVGLLGIALVTLIGGIARLVRLDDYPAGLAEAEAEHGLLARQSHDFGLQWAVENAGELSIPLMLVISWIGNLTGFDATAPRIAAALFGTGSILLTGLWIYRAIGPLWGLAGAAVLAGSFWHLLFSRLGTGPIVGAFALAALAWFLTEAIERQGRDALHWYVLAGLATGIGFLTTPALRLLPLMLLGILIVSLYRLRENPETSEARNWLLATAAAWLTISPFLFANRDNLRLWTPWTATPGLPGDEPATLATLPGALIDSVTGLFLSGDVERGMNLPADPWFSLLMLPWAVIGLLGIISASNNPARKDHFQAGLGLLIAALAGISAVDAGHPGHYVVVAPALAGLTVYGFRTALRWAKVRTVRIGLTVLVVMGIVGEAGYSAQQYIEEWAQEPETRLALHADVINALRAIETLDTGEPAFLSLTGHGSILDYFRTTARRYTFDGSAVLPFPADEDGYLFLPGSQTIDPQLEQLLDRSGSGTDSLGGYGFSGYRLDDRIRNLMPLSVPTAAYPRGPSLHGNSDLILTSDDTARFLIAWKSEPESPAFQVETRFRVHDTNAEDATTSTVELPANPLQTRLFQVLVVEIEISESDNTGDLEVRLRREDGTIVPVGGMDDEGYLLLDRYALGD